VLISSKNNPFYTENIQLNKRESKVKVASLITNY